MRTFVLVMAMATTVLTPSLASAADRPGDRVERRAEQRSDARADRALQRVDRRTDIARDRAVRRGDVGEARRVDRYEDRRVRQIDRREDRRDQRIDRRYDRDARYDRHDRYERRAESWNRDWRQDRRYDYRNYRRTNRSLYRAPRYYSPYRNRGYSRLTIGIGLGSGYYNNRYWINDPYRYRLPPARGPYRWVRYYNDAVLVDTRRGIVTDVIYGFFY